MTNKQTSGPAVQFDFDMNIVRQRIRCEMKTQGEQTDGVIGKGRIQDGVRLGRNISKTSSLFCVSERSNTEFN